MIAALTRTVAALAPPKDLPVTAPSTLSAAQALPQVQAGSLFADRNLQLTLIVLCFGLLALVLLYLMVRHERAGSFELRIFVITILVFGSLLILSAGFGGDQLGPVIGFFGTIAGYILGRGDRPSERN
jgi:hypothetical protein